MSKIIWKGNFNGTSQKDKYTPRGGKDTLNDEFLI